MPSEKVAITLDAPLLAGVEALRRRTGETRSAVIARAVRRLLDEERRRELVREYVEAYRRTPERDDEIDAADRAAAESLAQHPWDHDE